MKSHLSKLSYGSNNVTDYPFVQFTDPEEPNDPDKVTYNASSPDEEALVKGAAKFGFRFAARTQTDVHVVMPDNKKKIFVVKEVIVLIS